MIAHSPEEEPRGHPKVPLGRTVITRSALYRLTGDDVFTAIRRHIRGDWGNLDPEDWEENERSLREGRRLLSIYYGRRGTKFYIITEADRSITTVLLPEDY